MNKTVKQAQSLFSAAGGLEGERFLEQVIQIVPVAMMGAHRRIIKSSLGYGGRG